MTHNFELRYSADMQIVVVLRLLVLLTVANGAPVLAKDILQNRFAYPIDARVLFVDGRPLFGPSKTVRGILLSALGTSISAPLLRLTWQSGLLLGIVAMAGDLLSSFSKRRLHVPSGGRATGLDQIPESLFPLLACRTRFSLTVLDIAVTVGLFFIGEIVLSRLLFRLRLRDRPY